MFSLMNSPTCMTWWGWILGKGRRGFGGVRKEGKSLASWWGQFEAWGQGLPSLARNFCKKNWRG